MTERARLPGTKRPNKGASVRRRHTACAGGRLFLHRFNGKTMRGGLAEKVRIGQAAETRRPRRFRFPRDGIL